VKLLLDSMRSSGGSNEVFLSIASCWDLAIKLSLGKLWLTQRLDRFIPEQLTLNGFSLFAVPFLGRDTFLRNKRAAGRPQGSRGCSHCLGTSPQMARERSSGMREISSWRFNRGLIGLSSSMAASKDEFGSWKEKTERFKVRQNLVQSEGM
jgi:hypothetical protein